MICVSAMHCFPYSLLCCLRSSLVSTISNKQQGRSAVRTTCAAWRRFAAPIDLLNANLYAVLMSRTAGRPNGLAPTTLVADGKPPPLNSSVLIRVITLEREPFDVSLPARPAPPLNGAPPRRPH